MRGTLAHASAESGECFGSNSEELAFPAHSSESIPEQHPCENTRDETPAIGSIGTNEEDDHAGGLAPFADFVI